MWVLFCSLSLSFSLCLLLSRPLSFSQYNPPSIYLYLSLSRSSSEDPVCLVSCLCLLGLVTQIHNNSTSCYQQVTTWRRKLIVSNLKLRALTPSNFVSCVFFSPIYRWNGFSNKKKSYKLYRAFLSFFGNWLALLWFAIGRSQVRDRLSRCRASKHNEVSLQEVS